MFRSNPVLDFDAHVIHLEYLGFLARSEPGFSYCFALCGPNHARARVEAKFFAPDSFYVLGFVVSQNATTLTRFALPT